MTDVPPERLLQLQWIGGSHFTLEVVDGLTTVADVKGKIASPAFFETWRLRLLHGLEVLQDHQVISSDMNDLTVHVRSDTYWETKSFSELSPHDREHLCPSQLDMAPDTSCACFHSCRDELIAVYALTSSDGSCASVGCSVECECGGDVSITILYGHVVEAVHTGTNHRQAEELRQALTRTVQLQNEVELLHAQSRERSRSPRAVSSASDPDIVLHTRNADDVRAAIEMLQALVVLQEP